MSEAAYDEAMAAERYADDEARWRAVLERDPGAREAFLYAVRTTGVYCRPGCASRLPRRRNVEFFPDAGSAERAGYRPCRRCRPDGPAPAGDRVGVVVRACRRIEAAEEAPSLEELAGEAGMSPSRFHRLFRETVGVTPKRYAVVQRQRRFRGGLENGRSVTEAIYEAGFGSSSRAYEGSGRALGMSPSSYRQGGRGLTVEYTVLDCWLGRVLVATTKRGVCAIELGDDDDGLVEALRRRLPQARLRRGDGRLAAWAGAVVRHVERPGSTLEVPLDIQGTVFQHRVWEALRQIPAGETVTYAELARRIGSPAAIRAVAGACAGNRLAVAVPCHRAVRSDGGLGGYRWGLERKRRLLGREGERPDTDPDPAEG